MKTQEKIKENKRRRIANRRGLVLQKSRRRDLQALDFGGYMLVDARTKAAVYGADPTPFFASPGDIEAQLRRARRS